MSWEPLEQTFQELAVRFLHAGSDHHDSTVISMGTCTLDTNME